MKQPKVTILIPNYRTPELTKLCLRLIRKHTDPDLIDVIVVDNGSNDPSVEYLKSLSWITLLERKPEAEESPPLAHSKALNLGLEKTVTPYVLSIHTDTLVKRPDWLSVLLAEIEKSPDIAGVGSWKLEKPPRFAKKVWKLFEFMLRSFTYRMTNNTEKLKTVRAQKRSGYYNLFQNGARDFNEETRDFFYLRSHCALYRTDLLKTFDLSFATDNEPAGCGIHRFLLRKGYKMKFLSSQFLCRYLVHLNHATMVLNPELAGKNKTVKKGGKRIKKELDRLNSKQILRDATLDR